MSTVYPSTGYAGGAYNPDTLKLSVNFSEESAVLAWSAQVGAIKYRIYAGVNDQTMLPVETVVGVTTVTLSGLKHQSYAFQVISDMGGRNSICSSIVNVSTAGGPVGEVIYFGFLPTLTPTADQVLALSESEQDDFTGNFTLMQDGSAASYSSFAIPAAYGVPDLFESGGFQYNMGQFSVTIDGIAYTVYANPNPTFVTTQRWSIS